MTGELERLPPELRLALHAEVVPVWRTPTLATLTERRFSDPDWIFERKFDDMRCLASSDGSEVREVLNRMRRA